jgi:four helix bundle protein
MAKYENLEAWKACHELALAVYRVTESFPSDERYGLTSQARRAAFSAAANICEGSARRGKREFRRFLDISLGSLSELTYVFRLARDLKIITQKGWEELEKVRGRAGFLTWRLYRSIANGL